jgi:hypothetical protein
MLNPFDEFIFPERDPKQEARILSSVMPSDFIPALGDHFRVRFATYADRSYIDNIYQCAGVQDGCVLSRLVLGHSYDGNKLRSFIVGDMLFYNCTEAWKTANSTPVDAPAEPTAA